MTELNQLLLASDADIAVGGDWALVSAGGIHLRIPLAHLIEPLMCVRHGSQAVSDSVRELGDRAHRVLEAVADRRTEPHAETGRWRLCAHTGDDVVDALVHAFVTGPEPHQLTTTRPVVELSVSVSDHGRAFVAPTSGASERRTFDALRAAAATWAPLARLATGQPRADLTDAEIRELSTPLVRSTLIEAGIRVQWGKGVSSPEIEVGLDDDTGAVADWRLRLPSGTMSHADIAELAASHRPLVRIRGSWVVKDSEGLQQYQLLRRRTLTPGERVATLVTGTYVTADQRTVPLSQAATTQQRLAELTAHPPTVAVPQGLNATLRHYQLDGLSWMLRNAEHGLGSCLADDMGLGKTVSAIALHLALKERERTEPTLIVCPASVLNNWAREIRRFAPTQSVVPFHGSSRTVGSDTDFVVTTYATLRNAHHELRKTQWGLIIADEAQAVKNDTSKTARALRTLDAVHRLALSGTPIQNSLDDLWALLDWTTPGLLGSKRIFQQRYARPIKEGKEQPRSQLTTLSSIVLLRRRKNDPAIAPELPAKTISNRLVALSEEQIGLYQAVVDDCLAAIAELDVTARRGRILALLTALKQVCNHPAQYLGQTHPELPNRSGKLDALTEIIDIAHAESSPALVFTQYVTMGELIVTHLRERGIDTQLLHGGLDIAGRQRLIDAFQEGRLDHLVLSTHAAGTGVTLTRAEHVVHYDQWWNPAVEDQATDRAHRIGQTHPVVVHRLMCAGTLEERIDEILQSKRTLSESILDNEVSMQLSELDDASLASIVALRGRTR